MLNIVFFKKNISIFFYAQKETQIQRNKTTKKYKIQRNKKKTCLWPLSLCTTTQRLRILIWTSLQRVDVERNIDHKTESELVEFIRITVDIVKIVEFIRGIYSGPAMTVRLAKGKGTMGGRSTAAM